MDSTVLQVLTNPGIVALLSAAGGGVFGAIVGLRQLRYFNSAQAQALQVQTRATELLAFTSFNMRFLDIAENFEEHINNESTTEQHLSPTERRAIDRYFYLASMEYTLYKEGIISENLSALWLQGIKSAAKRRPFVERWNSTASKFTLNEDFRKFFESNI